MFCIMPQGEQRRNAVLRSGHEGSCCMSPWGKILGRGRDSQNTTERKTHGSGAQDFTPRES